MSRTPSHMQRIPSHEVMKARTLALLKKRPTLKSTWSAMEDLYANRSDKTKYEVLFAWTYAGEFKHRYEEAYGKLSGIVAAQIAKWLVEEMNEGL